jgi:predicted dehydrogenase
MKVILSGIGGYGSFYLNYLLGEDNTCCELTGAADPAPDRSTHLDALAARNIPVHASLEESLAEDQAELVILASPIQFHADQMCAALARGCHVLCEKPLCASLADIERMKAAERNSGRHVAIGYQWSFSRAIQALKQDLLAGALGAPKRFRTLVLWPRSYAYYARNNWAGRVRDDAGRQVLDSPVNNATAHYLHNMLYLLGPSLSRSARPTSIDAELYRVNNIENFDTVVMRVATDAGAEVLFYSTHAVRDERGPEFVLECANATVTYKWHEAIVARFADGTEKSYGDPDAGPHRKLTCTAEAITAGSEALCGIDAASAHTECVCALHKQCDIAPFSEERIRVGEHDGTCWTWVDGLDAQMVAAYDAGAASLGI